MVLLLLFVGKLQRIVHINRDILPKSGYISPMLAALATVQSQSGPVDGVHSGIRTIVQWPQNCHTFTQIMCIWQMIYISR